MKFLNIFIQFKKQIITYFLALALIIVGLVIIFTVLVNSPNTLPSPVTFEIPSGYGVKAIGQKLENENIISAKYIYVFQSVLSGKADSVQAGVYTIKPGMTVKDLVGLFQFGTKDKALTFVEGWRREQFAEYAAENLPNVEYTDFLDATQGKEGFLFPDTYFLSADTTTSQLVNLLTETFDSKANEVLTKTDLTKDEAVILASLVERETISVEDRRLVAGILIKRYQEGIPLQVDATVQYIIGNAVDWWPKNITQQDLEIESPYNSRKYVGLPPAPISSFALSALEAVVEPTDSPYYYYITGNDGQMYYAVSYDEHLANIAKHL